MDQATDSYVRRIAALQKQLAVLKAENARLRDLLNFPAGDQTSDMLVYIREALQREETP